MFNLFAFEYINVYFLVGFGTWFYKLPKLEKSGFIYTIAMLPVFLVMGIMAPYLAGDL
jgi:hypothetical protein